MTATKQAKIVFELVNPGTDALAATNYLRSLTIDGMVVMPIGLTQDGGNKTVGTLIWSNGGGPTPGDHTVLITVNLKSGGTATMKVATINFAN